MNTKNLVRTSILTAIVYVSMSLLHITLFNSALHLGSLVIVVISLIFPRKQAIYASSIGATLFDIFSGYLIYAPFTFIARLSLSYIVSLSKEKSILYQLIYSFAGGIVVIVIYFISYLIILGGFSESIYASSADFIQLLLTLLGVLITIPIKKVFPKQT